MLTVQKATTLGARASASSTSAVVASPTRVPQLLMVYSARFNAQTIRVHVERLRDKGFVWWGRFSGDGARLDEAAARARWPHVASLVDARASAREPLLLFITNYVDLHVLKVTEVVFGELPSARARKEALPYYGTRSVPLWFRVADARALSYDQNLTNDAFDRQLGPVRAGALRSNGQPYDRPYDPTAAIHYQYPIVLDAPTAADVFDRPRPQGGRRWADAPDAISSRPVQSARAHVELALTSPLWKRLTPDAQDLLANGWVEKGRMDHDHDVDPAMGFTRIANAVERELCGELITSLTDLCTRLKAGRHPFGDVLGGELRASAPKSLSGQPVPWSMGAALDVLRHLLREHSRAMRALKMLTLIQLCQNLEGLEDLKRLRDPASHGRAHAFHAEMRRAVVAFYADGGGPLGLVVRARDEVERVHTS